MAKHKWKTDAGKSDDQTCELCGSRRVRVSNNRRRPGTHLGRHWEHWHKGGRLTRSAPRCVPTGTSDKVTP